MRVEILYHCMTVANPWYKLLKEKPCLQHNIIVTNFNHGRNTAFKTNERNTIRTSSSLNRPALHIRSNSSPPEAYSITIAKCVGVSITYIWRVRVQLQININKYTKVRRNVIKHYISPAPFSTNTSKKSVSMSVWHDTDKLLSVSVSGVRVRVRVRAS